MSNIYSYKEIIEGLNNSKIIKVSFFIEDYSHYKSCRIYRAYEPVTCLKVELTKDSSEHISFWKFKEDFKLFNFGKKGKFTLKQIWDKVCITEIIYSEQK